jgi:hypothetical protein
MWYKAAREHNITWTASRVMPASDDSVYGAGPQTKEFWNFYFRFRPSHRMALDPNAYILKGNEGSVRGIHDIGTRRKF